RTCRRQARSAQDINERHLHLGLHFVDLVGELLLDRHVLSHPLPHHLLLPHALLLREALLLHLLHLLLLHLLLHGLLLFGLLLRGQLRLLRLLLRRLHLLRLRRRLLHRLLHVGAVDDLGGRRRLLCLRLLRSVGGRSLLRSLLLPLGVELLGRQDHRRFNR